MRRVRIALAAGLALIAAAAAGVLSESPPVVLATNAVTARESVAAGWRQANACQAGEGLPAHTTAIRLVISAVYGPRVTVEARDGSRVLTSGEQPSGWTGKSVTVPVRPLSSTVHPVAICFAAADSHEGVNVGGTTEAAGALTSRGRPLKGRMAVEYLGNGRSSWLELASAVAGQMALGRAWPGIWVVFAAAALMLACAVVASRLALVELGGAREAQTPARQPRNGQGWSLRATIRRAVPGAALACALVACLSAAGWSLITPPFESVDEPDHFAYVKQLAETGTLPTSTDGPFSREEQGAIDALGSEEIRLSPSVRPVFSQTTQDLLDERLQALREDHGSPGAGVATQEPPLYYALESVPYLLGSGGTLLDRLQLMRLLSVLMAGLTALFAFLFLRETLPRVPWAWTVGALAVALCPLFSFMSGAVNPDAMLYAESAALFYCIARALRRGLTTRSAAAFGLVVAAGFLTKLNFIGLAPGAFLALAVLAVRGARGNGRGALWRPAAAAAIGASPVVLFVGHNVVASHSPLGIVAEAVGTTSGSVLDVANYVWQLYLPRLPGTANDFPGLSTARQIWFDGYVGRLGWLDTTFPDWVYTLALILAGAIAALCARTLIAGTHTLRRRLPELAVYAVMALGLMALVGTDSYRMFPELTASYGQARYLLPLLPLLAAALALSARGAGRRWGPVAGTLIVVLFLAHDIFSQLQAIARYYG
jgi:hypothetical protein